MKAIIIPEGGSMNYGDIVELEYIPQIGTIMWHQFSDEYIDSVKNSKAESIELSRYSTGDSFYFDEAQLICNTIYDHADKVTYIFLRDECGL